jgi:hypothetical protein
MPQVHKIDRRSPRRFVVRSLLFILVGIVLLVGYKSVRVYILTQRLRGDLAAIEAAAQTQSLANLPALHALIHIARDDAHALRDEAIPLLPFTRWLGWVPYYGADLAAAGPLLNLVTDVTDAGDEGLGALALLLAPRSDSRPLSGALTERLIVAQPQLSAARQAIDRAIAAQRQLPLDDLSPAIRTPLTRLAPLLPTARDGLSFALLAPRLLGAERAQSYLLLALNQDELRAGGGFITAAGLLTFEDGQRTEFSMSNSPEIDNRQAHRYPPPPEPMRRYMDIPQWIFADTNWSPDFPTSAAQAMHFYKLGQDRDVDGVVAFDQAALQQLVGAIGPVSVEGLTEPISADNVISYIRNARVAGSVGQPDWQRRKGAFISRLAAPLVAKLERDPASINVPQLARALRRMLDEKHIQVFLNDPEAQSLLSMYGWDGAVRPGMGDFLMVVDSNVGYNKVNPNIRQEIAYDLDLRDLRAPTATATITYTHLLDTPRLCKSPAGYGHDYSYAALMTRCYADFLRVLIPSGSQLIGTQTEPTPGPWLLSGMADDGAVAVSQGESTTWELSTFLVVPIGETRTVTFSYHLPSEVLDLDGERWSYQLRLQKQAGTDAIPFRVYLRLPDGATILGDAPVATGGLPVIAGRLNQDQAITVDFLVP